MRFLPFFALASVSLSLFSMTHDAGACGGCFHPPPPVPVPGESQSPTVVTDHRILVALNDDRTTLWDQIEYAGDPSDFAWILPVRGAAEVGVGDNDFIDAIDQQTTPILHSPSVQCQYPSSGGGGGGGCICVGFGGASAEDNSGAPNSGIDGGNEGVTVTSQETVGPYDVVQIHGTDAMSIVDWLTSHSYVIPAEIKPILDAYVGEGFDFVAVRLAPNAAVKEMRPIRVTWGGKNLSLPLRMVAAGVGDKVGIKLFVVGDGRWTIGNFFTFPIDPASLTWDFKTERSDYTTQRDAIAQAHGYSAFALESSVTIRASALPTKPSSGLDAGAGDTGAGDAGAADTGAGDTDAGDADAGETGAAPSVSDLDIAFGTHVARRVTRLRGDIAASALSTDLVLQADVDQAERPIDVYVKKFANGDAVCAGGTLEPANGSNVPASILKLEAASGCATGGSAPTRWSLGVAFAAVAASILRRARKR